MEKLSPPGPVYQAGTLSGNPLAMTAGLWALDRLKPKLYTQLAKHTSDLAEGLAEAARKAGVPLQVNAVGSMITPFFTGQRVRDYATATSSDTKAFAAFFTAMLEHGCYLPPSQSEAWFLSSAHTSKDVGATIKAARAAMRKVGASRGGGDLARGDSRRR